MPQRHLPMFPAGVTHITNELAFERRDGKIAYFNGHMPVFAHAEDDVATFRMITSQFCESGYAKQCDIIRAFGGTVAAETQGDVLGEPFGLATAKASQLAAAAVGGELATRSIDEIPIACSLAARAHPLLIVLLNGRTHFARRRAESSTKNSMKMGYSRKSALLANFHNTLVKVTRGRKDVARAVEAPFAQFIGKRCFSPSQQRLHVAWCDRETTCEHSQREVSLQEASIKFP